MQPSDQFRFLTYPFNMFIYHSNEYIHLKKIEPQSLISLIKWTIRCIMISKNEGGKYISSWHSVTTTSFCNSFSFIGSITLLHIVLKQKQSRVMTWRTCYGNIEYIVTVSNYCINTWQSRNFKPTSFRSFIELRLWIFGE